MVKSVREISGCSSQFCCEDKTSLKSKAHYKKFPVRLWMTHMTKCSDWMKITASKLYQLAIKFQNIFLNNVYFATHS